MAWTNFASNEISCQYLNLNRADADWTVPDQATGANQSEEQKQSDFNWKHANMEPNSHQQAFSWGLKMNKK